MDIKRDGSRPSTKAPEAYFSAPCQCFSPGGNHTTSPGRISSIATPTTAMTHIAVQESLNGKNVDWLEKVSDEQYRTRGRIRPARVS